MAVFCEDPPLPVSIVGVRPQNVERRLPTGRVVSCPDPYHRGRWFAGWVVVCPDPHHRWWQIARWSGICLDPSLMVSVREKGCLLPRPLRPTTVLLQQEPVTSVVACGTGCFVPRPHYNRRLSMYRRIGVLRGGWSCSRVASECGRGSKCQSPSRVRCHSCCQRPTFGCF